MPHPRSFLRLLAALTGLSTLAHPIGTRGDTHSAISPVSKTDQGWKDRAKLLDERVRSTPDTRILFVGDSITQGWEGHGKAAWDKFYAPRKAVNLGIGGDRTQHVLWRLKHAPLEGVRPEVAVVMIGTNNSNGEDNSAAQIVEGIGAIVDLLGKRLPQTKVLLLGIFPRGENFNAQRGKLTQINQVLGKWHDGRRVHYLDIGHVFLNREGLLPAAIMYDYLHLTADGYRIWAEAIEGKVAELLGEKPVAQVGSSPLDGEWVWTTKGPENTDVTAALHLAVDQQALGGRFVMGEDRVLKIEQGNVQDETVRFIVRRQRSQGGEMVYRMSGRLQGSVLEGEVTTEVEGRSMTQPWSARRK